MGRRRVVGPRCDTGVKAADFILALTLFGGQGYHSVWWETGAQQRWPRSPAAAYLTVLLSRSPRDGRAGESPGYEQTHRFFYQYHRSRSGHDSMQTRYFLRSACTAIHRRATQEGRTVP